MTLQMALIGYQAERQRIQEKIAELQAQLGGRGRRSGVPMAEVAGKRGMRRMSAAARKRIADAQRKRWAEFRKNQRAA